jgi:hypothetical protein
VVKERILNKDWGIGKKKSLKGENLTREKMVIMMSVMSITRDEIFVEVQSGEITSKWCNFRFLNHVMTSET